MLETVKVVADTERGWKIINKEDMKPNDVIYGEAPKKPAPKKKQVRDNG